MLGTCGTKTGMCGRFAQVKEEPAQRAGDTEQST